MLNLGDKVAVMKLGASENPRYEPADASKYVYGADNGNVSLPVGYVVEGHVACAPEKGYPFGLLREVRNGVPIPGVFLTSPIQKTKDIGGGLFVLHTNNSIYLVTKLKAEGSRDGTDAETEKTES